MRGFDRVLDANSRGLVFKLVIGSCVFFFFVIAFFLITIARGKYEPERVTVSTYGANTFTVSYFTEWKTGSELEVADNKDFENSLIFKDVRDAVESENTGKDITEERNSHVLVARGLEPDTKYWYKVRTIFNDRFDQDLFTLTTPKVNADVPQPEPIFGEVVKQDGTPQANILVEIYKEEAGGRRSSKLVTYTSEDGTYSADLANLRTPDLSEYWEDDPEVPTKTRVVAMSDKETLYWDIYDNEVEPVQTFMFKNINEFYSDVGESVLDKVGQRIIPKVMAAECPEQQSIEESERAYNEWKASTGQTDSAWEAQIQEAKNRCASFHSDNGGEKSSSPSGENACEKAHNLYLEYLNKGNDECNAGNNDEVYRLRVECAELTNKEAPERQSCEAPVRRPDSPASDDVAPAQRTNKCEKIDEAAGNVWINCVADGVGQPCNTETGESSGSRYCTNLCGNGGRCVQTVESGSDYDGVPGQPGANPAPAAQPQRRGCLDKNHNGKNGCMATVNGQETGEFIEGKVCKEDTCVDAPQPPVERGGDIPLRTYDCSRSSAHNVAICCGNSNTNLSWEDPNKGNCRDGDAWARCENEVEVHCKPEEQEPAPTRRPDPSPGDPDPAPRPTPNPTDQPLPTPPQEEPNPDTPDQTVDIPVDQQTVPANYNSRFESIRQVLREYKPVDGTPVGTFGMQTHGWGVNSQWAGSVRISFCGLNANAGSCYDGSPAERRGIGGAHVIPPGGVWEYNDVLGNPSASASRAKYKDYPQFSHCSNCTPLLGTCEFATSIRVAAHKAGLREERFNTPGEVGSRGMSYGTGGGYKGHIKHWSHSNVSYSTFGKVAYNNENLPDIGMFVAIWELADGPSDGFSDGDLNIENHANNDLIILVDNDQNDPNIYKTTVFFGEKRDVMVDNDEKNKLTKVQPEVKGITTKVQAEDDNSITLESGETIAPGTYRFDNNTTLNIEDPSTVNFFVDTNGNGVKDDGEEIVVKKSFELAKESDSFQYYLHTGWNTLSFPFGKDEDTFYKASEVMRSAKGKNIDIETLKKWEGKWVEYTLKDGATYGEDFDIIPGQGYFIKSNTQGNLDLMGVQISESAPIQTLNGWALVGVNSPLESNDLLYRNEEFRDGVTAFELLQVMTSTDTELNVNNVTRYDSGVYRGVNVVKGDSGQYRRYGLDFDLNSNEAYFIRSSKKSVFIP